MILAGLLSVGGIIGLAGASNFSSEYDAGVVYARARWKVENQRKMKD